MALAAAKPLTIWAVSDGRAGIEAQALGLAEAVARLRAAEVIVKHVRWPGGLGRLPWRLIPPTLRTGDPVTPPWPDIWIAAGRASLPLSTRMKRWSAGRTFVVQLQDPRTGLAPYDLVIPPRHDRLEGPNVFPILGAPNRLTAGKLAEALAARPDIAALPAPRFAAIIGGKSRAFDLPVARAREIAGEIRSLVSESGGSLMLSFTRRTPPDAAKAMADLLRGLSGVIWDGSGANPYFAFLAAADAVLATEDSANLATDAASAGKPLYRLALPGRSEKLARLHAELDAGGYAAPFRGRLTLGPPPPLDETERAARALLRRHENARSPL